MSFEECYNKIHKFLEGFFSELGTDFLVEVSILPGNQITVLFDSEEGVTVDKCAKLNRALYKFIEETGMYPDGNFALEVSSPGVDEPLKFHRQYMKNVDRDVEVTLFDGTLRSGKMLSASGEGIIVEEKTGKGKKAELKNHEISFEKIKSTRVLIKI